MSFGLQTWGPNGEPDVEVTRRLTRYLGSFVTGTSAGSYVINDVPPGAELWIFVEAAVPVGNMNYSPAEISLSGNTVSWQFNVYRGTKISATVHYGVY